MAITITCDLCGQPIDPSDPYVNVDVTTAHRTGALTEARAPRFSSGWLGHYHADGGPGKDCFDQLDELVQMVRSQAQAIGGIPVATDAEIRARRGPAEYEAALARLEEVDGIGPGTRSTLAGARIDPDRAARMSDDELLAIKGVGPATVRRLRAAIDHNPPSTR